MFTRWTLTTWKLLKTLVSNSVWCRLTSTAINPDRLSQTAVTSPP
jgi:hypothetical protein